MPERDRSRSTTRACLSRSERGGGIIDSKLAECVVHLNQPFENVDAEESVQQALPYGSHVELPLRTPIDENASVVHDEKSSAPIESK